MASSSYSFSELLRHSLNLQRIQKRKSIFREPGKYLDRGKYFSKISSHVGNVFVSFSTHGNLSHPTGFWSCWNFYSHVPIGKIWLGVNSVLTLLTRAGTIFFNVFGFSQTSEFPFKPVNNIKSVYRKSIFIFSILMMSVWLDFVWKCILLSSACIWILVNIDRLSSSWTWRMLRYRLAL